MCTSNPGTVPAPLSPSLLLVHSGAQAAVLALSSTIFVARKCSKCASTGALLPLILFQVTHRVLLELPLWSFLFKSISSVLSLKRSLLITSHPPRMPSATVRFALLCIELWACDTSSLQLHLCPCHLGTILLPPRVQFNPSGGYKYLWDSQLVFKFSSHCDGRRKV